MAQQKKSFKNNPALQFISTAEEKQEAPQQAAAPQAGTAAEGLNIPRGYRLVPELKSARVQLLISPATKSSIKKMAANEGISMNEMINRILIDALERQGE